MVFTYPPILQSGDFCVFGDNAQRLRVFVYKVYKFAFLVESMSVGMLLYDQGNYVISQPKL